MAYQRIDFHIRGVAGLIMHNSRLANPTDPIVREIKKITSKRKKTDQDHIDLANLEWEGGLNLDAKGQPCIPGENLEAMITESARAQKLGKTFKAALLCDGDWPVIFDGPKDVRKLRDDPKFRLAKMMTVMRQRVLRTRPLFPSWECKFTVHFHPEMLNRQQVVDTLKYGGEMVGLCDSRPKFGRFQIVS